jgi:NADPH2:quinone reductase
MARFAQRRVSRGVSTSTKFPARRPCFSWGLSQLVFLGLKPPPPQRYPLSAAEAALQCLADGGVLGKLVLEP